MRRALRSLGGARGCTNRAPHGRPLAGAHVPHPWSPLLASLVAAAAPSGCDGRAEPAPSRPTTSTTTVTPTEPTHLLTQQTSGWRLQSETVLRDAAAWSNAWRT